MFHILSVLDLIKGLLRSESDSAPRETKENSDEDIEPRILAMIEEREKPTEDEKRLTDLASKILEDALKQSDETKAERTFMKLQNIINQLVSYSPLIDCQLCLFFFCSRIIFKSFD